MLEGTLDTFTLPDIFQLLAFTKKTGCLRLERDTSRGRVWFRDGQVYFAVATTGGLALGRRLVGAGLVSNDQLKRALDEQSGKARDRQGLRLGQILVEDEVIDEDTLEVFIREQIQDAVFDLMRWSSGAFEFRMSGEDAVIDEPIQLSVSVENLIMEGSRRLEEWENVRKKIPTPNAVVAMAPRPSDNGAGVEVNLQPDEWRLLTLVDGRRTVRELVGLYGQGEFQTVKVLYGLVGAGLLEVRDPELEGPPSIAALLEQQELLRQLEEDEPGETSRLRVPDAEPVTSPPEPEPEAAPAAEVAPEPGQEPDTEAEDEPEPLVMAADGEDDDEEPVDVTDEEAVAEAEPEPESSDDGKPAGRAPLKARPAGRGGKRTSEQRLTTDPEIDADLVQRLIDGVKEL